MLRTFLLALIVASTPSLTAQAGSLATIFSFPATSTTFGRGPGAGLTELDGVLYGTTEWGGSNQAGSVFSIDPDGTNFQTLYSFGAKADGFAYRPEAPVTIVGSRIYGTTHFGGGAQEGIAYAMDLSGVNFKLLHTFVTQTGSYPQSGLTMVNGVLYGSAPEKTLFNNGALYSIDAAGFYNVVHTFLDSVSHDGNHPSSALLQVGSQLYGTADYGGLQGGGTLFSMNPDGSAFTVLHNFALQGLPSAGLTLVGSRLYGTTRNGSSGFGNIYSLNLDGSDFQVLHSFAASEGTFPNGLTAVGSRLYGTTQSGASFNGGSLFSLNLDGSDFQVEHVFHNSLTEGERPFGNLLLLGSTLYGTTSAGGATDSGTIFTYTVPEPGTWLLALVGSVGVGAVVRRAHRRK